MGLPPMSAMGSYRDRGMHASSELRSPSKSILNLVKRWSRTVSLFLMVATTANANALEPRFNSIEIAGRFRGSTWAERINAAVAALPPSGGTIDAEGLCLDGTLATANTDVVLGSDTRKVRLKLGTCIYPLGAHNILYFPNTEVGGMGIRVPGNAGTTITYTGSGAGFRYGGALQNTGVYNVFLHDFSITGDGTAGSIGIDMTYALASTLERISTDGSDNGWKFGGTTTCSCYNQIIQVLAFDHSRGGWLDQTANQNQIFGGAVRADSVTGVGLDISGAASNQIYSLDIESSAEYSIKLERNVYNPNGNSIVNPYIEAAGPIQIDSGASYNSIVGNGGLFERGSVVDQSGNNSNYIHQTGGGGGTDGVWPYYEVVQDGLYFGVSPSNSFKLLSDGSEPGSALELKWTDGVFAPQCGLSGHAPLEVGEAILHSGANIAGRTSTAMITNLDAPVIISKGLSGKTTYRYFLVCHDKNGGITLPSPAGSIATGNDLLSAVNYNEIRWRAIDGCWSWDILKGDTSTSVATLQQPQLSHEPESVSITFKDTGKTTRPYTPPTRNTTGDLSVSGMSISKGIGWPLPEAVANGGSFYCPNCDPPMNPPTECTSHGDRTGSWVHGLNNHWMCVP